MNISPDQQLEYLLALSGENEIVEYKHAQNQFDFKKLGKYFSALSNEANLKMDNSAWLIFGVNNQRCVVGTQFRLQRPDIESLKKEIADRITHRLSFIEIYEVNHAKGRVLLFEIPAAPQGMPTAFDGHYYGRDGESLSPLNIDEIERIRAQSSINDWSAAVCEDATVEDLCTDALVKARELFTTKNPKLKDDIARWDDDTFLRKARLSIKGKLTRTAILLLGKTESEHFLSPANTRISWILKDRDGLEKDYAHSSLPLLLAVDEVFSHIRNLKYRYIKDGSLFPDEVDQYEPYIIREALNNCIAHQDYRLGGKISVVEFEDARLCFSNVGSFIPQTVEQVLKSDAPESRYRNPFLANAMVSLNMIDTIGSGIRKMFVLQKNKFFPLPEYDLSNDRVMVTITGKVLDIEYARQLAGSPDLGLDDIVLLDRVQKRFPITDKQTKYLRDLKLIEGRKPNYHVSSGVAAHSGQKANYIRQKGLDDDYYRAIICEYLENFGTAKRAEIDGLLLDKLPEILDEKQKENKIRNLIQSLKNQGVICIDGRLWRMSKR